MVSARSYREDANMMMDRYGKPYSAAALLYEAAKQCVNAVANLSSQNPGAIGAKRAYIRSLADQPYAFEFDLMRGWEGATRLHIHADRGHLTEDLFNNAWQLSQTFIDNLLAIYADNSTTTA